MAKSKTIEVQGVSIAIEQIREEDYISLTDIAKKSDSESKHLIISWLKNTSTVQYLEAWESLHNPDFKVDQLVNFRINLLQAETIAYLHRLPFNPETLKNRNYEQAPFQ